jgi:hypothetical protein
MLDQFAFDWGRYISIIVWDGASGRIYKLYDPYYNCIMSRMLGQCGELESSQSGAYMT